MNQKSRSDKRQCVKKIDYKVFQIKYFSTDLVLYETSPKDCTCWYFKCIKLPCKHILKIRLLTDSKNLKDDIGDLCSLRWTKEY